VKSPCAARAGRAALPPAANPRPSESRGNAVVSRNPAPAARHRVGKRALITASRYVSAAQKDVAPMPLHRRLHAQRAIRLGVESHSYAPELTSTSSKRVLLAAVNWQQSGQGRVLHTQSAVRTRCEKSSAEDQSLTEKGLLHAPPHRSRIRRGQRRNVKFLIAPGPPEH